MGHKVFNLSLPPELLAIINNQAKLNYMSRNEYIKQALVIQLRSEGALGPDLVTTPIPNQADPSPPPEKRQPVMNANGLGVGRDIALENFLKQYELENPGSLDSTT